MGYTIKEIIDIAIGMEEAGLTFYKKVAEKFDDQHVKDIFLYLANQEIVHKEMFQKLSGKQGDKTGVYNDEYFLFMKAIGGDKIYPTSSDIDKIMNTIQTPLDAINKGFQDEKEAILFYSEIKQYYENDAETKEIIEKIISEERKHALSLWDLKESLS